MDRPPGRGGPCGRSACRRSGTRSGSGAGGAAGSCPRIFTRSTSSALALMSGSAVSWKTTASTLMSARHQQDGQARPVEAHPGRLERVELALAGEGEEQEHGGDQHDHRQALVELAGQPVEEVLEDRDEGRLGAQEAVEGLQQIHHQEEHRADAGPDAEEDQVLPDQVAVDDEGGRARAGEPAEPAPPAALLQRLGHPPRFAARRSSPRAARTDRPRRGARPRRSRAAGSRPTTARMALGIQTAMPAGMRPRRAMPSMRRVEDVVGHHDAEAQREGDRAPAPVARGCRAGSP